MEGYDAVIFGMDKLPLAKLTLSGSDDEPGIIPRTMRGVFRYIKRTPKRKYPVAAIWKYTMKPLLARPMVAKANLVQIQGGLISFSLH